MPAFENAVTTSAVIWSTAMDRAARTTAALASAAMSGRVLIRPGNAPGRPVGGRSVHAVRLMPTLRSEDERSFDLEPTNRRAGIVDLIEFPIAPRSTAEPGSTTIIGGILPAG